METYMNVGREITALGNMSVDRLRQRYAEVFGEVSGVDRAERDGDGLRSRVGGDHQLSPLFAKGEQKQQLFGAQLGQCGGMVMFGQPTQSLNTLGQQRG